MANLLSDIYKKVKPIASGAFNAVKNEGYALNQARIDTGKAISNATGLNRYALDPRISYNQVVKPTAKFVGNTVYNSIPNQSVPGISNPLKLGLAKVFKPQDVSNIINQSNQQNTTFRNSNGQVTPEFKNMIKENSDRFVMGGISGGGVGNAGKGIIKGLKPKVSEVKPSFTPLSNEQYQIGLKNIESEAAKSGYIPQAPNESTAEGLKMVNDWVKNNRPVKVSSQPPDNVNNSSTGANAVKNKSLDLSQIESSISTKAPKEKINVKQTTQDFATNYLNRFQPVLDYTKGKNLTPEKNPYYAIKQYMGGEGIANAKIDFELKPIIQSVNDSQSLNDLRSLMVAQTQTERATRGVGKDASVAIEQLRAKVGDAKFNQLNQNAQKLRDYESKLLDEWASVGGLSPEGLATIKSQNQMHAPLQRVMDDLETSGFIQAGNKSLNSSKQVIQKATGSDRAIIDPIESIVGNTYKMQQAIQKQKVANSLVELGKLDGGFKPVSSAEGKSTLSVFENGKKQLYEAPKEIVDAVKGMEEEQLNSAIKMMSLPAKLLRSGATGLNVGFAVPNVVRDQMSAAVNSKYGGIPMYDYVSGMASFLKKDNVYKDWLLSGADQASFVSQDRTGLQRNLKNLTSTKWQNAGKLVSNPIELLRAFSDLSEKGTRVGVYKRALKGATKEYGAGANANLEAMLQSREATIDFSQRGSKMKAYNAITPFLNARLQGANKLLSSFKQRPIQTGAIGMAIAGLPAAVLYVHNSQDPAYNEIPDYIKNNNFIIMTGNKDTPFIKIPKGEIGQIFGNPVENFMAYAMQNDSQGFGEMAKNIIASISPVSNIGDVIPTAFKLPLELASNYDTFRGQNIVSQYKKDLPAPLQTNASTTDTAKAVGNAFNLSPAKVDYTINSLTGGLGKQATQAIDTVAFGKQPKTNQLPVLDRFMGEPKDLSKTASMIYDNEAKRKQEQATINYKAKELIQKGLETGNQDLLNEAAKLNPESFNSFVTDTIKLMEKTGMTPEQKAIQSLPKKQQVIIEEQLKNGEKITPNNTSVSAKSSVGSTSKASAAESSTNLFEGIKPVGSSYLYNGKVYSDEDGANKAAAKEQLKQGKVKSITKGDNVYSLNKSGDLNTDSLSELKDKALSNKLTLDIQTAKNTGDYNTWLELQTQKAIGIQNKITNADPIADQANVVTWQNQLDDVLQSIKKQKNYGGSMTKPKKAKKPKVVKVSMPKVSIKTTEYKIKAPKVSQPKIRKYKVNKPKLVKQPKR